ncbi:MAG: hypothetical protein AAF614_08050 [Chloroflexota bacterium]
MPLPLPNLDDRSFEEMLDEALDVIQRHLHSDWNDLSLSDPGRVLLEAFTYLTEQLIFRLNRLPPKAYIAFLRLLGVTQQSTWAAKLQIEAVYEGNDEATPAAQPVRIEKGTRLIPQERAGSEASLSFYLERELTFATGVATSTVRQFEMVTAEVLGVSTGRPNEQFAVKRTPIVEPMGNGFDVLVAVALDANEVRQLTERDYQVVEDLNSVQAFSQWKGADPIFKLATEDKYYRLWREVENFSTLEAKGGYVYAVDRLDGLIQFAPLARYTSQLRDAPHSQLAPARLQELKAIPPKNSEILAWYPHGGGAAGNLPPKSELEIFPEDMGLVVNRAGEGVGETAVQAINIRVTKLVEPGLAAETLEDALIRAPNELFSLSRAITTSEIEAVAMRRTQGRIQRAHAYTMQARWRHAQPGTIGVVLVPIPKATLYTNTAGQGEAADLLTTLRNSEDSQILSDVAAVLRDKIPAGIPTNISWTRYKQIRIRANVEIEADASPGQVQAAVQTELQDFLAPQRWPYGRPLTVKEIYSFLNQRDQVQDILQVLDVQVELLDAPYQSVGQLAADHFQPGAWYATSEDKLFRSLNNGTGWARMMQLAPWDETEEADESVQFDESEARFTLVVPSPHKAGLVAAVSIHRQAGNNDWRSRLYLTQDCWESAPSKVDKGIKELHFKIEDMAWLRRGEEQFLLLATDRGLYDLKVDGEHLLETPMQQFSVLTDRPDYPLYAVAVIEGSMGVSRIAVALKSQRGVFISRSHHLKKNRQQTVQTERFGNLRQVTEVLLGHTISTATWERFMHDKQASSHHIQRNKRQELEALLDHKLPEDLWEAMTDDRQQEKVRYDADIWEKIDGLVGADIRQLKVQPHHEHIFLWAAARAEADRGQGCYRIRFELDGQNRQAGAWVATDSWVGGSCLGVAFHGSAVFAATAYRGVLKLTLEPDNPHIESWQAMQPTQLPQLPLRLDLENELKEERLFAPLVTVASNHRQAGGNDAVLPVIMIGGRQGIYRTTDGGATYQESGQQLFASQRDVVTLPPNWLFASAVHEVTVSRADDFGQTLGQWSATAYA